MANTIKALWGSASSRLPHDSLRIDALTLQLLAQVCEDPLLSPMLDDHADTRIRAVIEYIEDQMCEALSISELAVIAGMSAGHFARSFKATMGEAVWDCAQRRRCERAQEMLLYGHKSSGEIALNTGFAGISHMTTSIDSVLAAQGRSESIRSVVRQAEDTGSVHTGGLSVTALCRVLDWTEDALAEDLDLAQMASVAGLSPWHFARCFKAETGMTPASYVMHRRVERARVMLAGTDASVTQIAFACGFSSSQHMATVFRRILGTTPTAYRQERRS